MQTIKVKLSEMYPEMKNCSITLEFIERFNKLIDFMNSKSAYKAAMWRNNDKKV